MSIRELKVGSKATLPVYAGNNSASLEPVTVLWIHPKGWFVHVALNNKDIKESIWVNPRTGLVG